MLHYAKSGIKLIVGCYSASNRLLRVIKCFRFKTRRNNVNLLSLSSNYAVTISFSIVLLFLHGHNFAERFDRGEKLRKATSILFVIKIRITYFQC